jgi:hypothetical protein
LLAFANQFNYGSCMSVQELEAQVAKLSPTEFAAFAGWFEEFAAKCWDQQLEADIEAGKLDHLARQADEQFEAGRCKPL